MADINLAATLRQSDEFMKIGGILVLGSSTTGTEFDEIIEAEETVEFAGEVDLELEPMEEAEDGFLASTNGEPVRMLAEFIFVLSEAGSFGDFLAFVGGGLEVEERSEPSVFGGERRLAPPR